MKSNLPVLLLRGIVLLPDNDIKLELEGTGRAIIDVAELFHENHMLVVSPRDSKEENPNVQELPKVGIIARMDHKIELPSGKIRVILKGLHRANIFEYLNLNKSTDVLEAIFENSLEEVLKEQEQKAMLRKLYHEVEKYAQNVSYASNSILSDILNANSLSKATDKVAPTLPLSYERMQQYLEELRATSRTKMLLEDIYHEEEMFQIEKDLDARVHEHMDLNQKNFFLREKIKVLKQELGEVSFKNSDVQKFYKRMEEKEFPFEIRKRLEQEIVYYENLSENAIDLSIRYQYIDWLLSLPWGIYTKDCTDLDLVKEFLDHTHGGLEEIKLQVLEYVAVCKRKQQNSFILCFVGPPGVGKTSLASTIAQAMNRKFVKISVGGLSDEAEIKGHRKTYLGAAPGRIIQAMRKAGSCNPVFLIDEIDKMTKNIHGDPASALLEVLDPEQNHCYSDHFIEESYDLSKVFFIATANHLEDIPEALRDRMEVISLTGYSEYEKLDLVKNYLIPRVCLEYSFPVEFVSFSDEAILDMIRLYTKEAGIRELSRQISVIFRKLLMNFEKNISSFDVVFIDTKDLSFYLGSPKYIRGCIKSHVGMCLGLAYTSYGGDVLSIEVTFYEGEGKIYLTGSLGDVLRESAYIALSYIKTHFKDFSLDYKIFDQKDFHIHIPEGAIFKDGPSAGVALTTALLSALTGCTLKSNCAITGEMTLGGQILPIGGLKEKSIGALREGIKMIFLPLGNQKDFLKLPLECRENIEYIFVEDYLELYQLMREKNLWEKSIVTKKLIK